ncbi:MAG TPA: DUF1569 domain-containing protein [Vicinamibacterales bacterium]
MKSVWNAHDQRHLHDRIARLTPTTRPRWGKMNISQMVMHLCEALRMASGELVIPSKNVPLRHTPIKQLVIYWAPFPRGAPTAKELVARAPGDWSADIRELQSRLDDYVRRGPEHATAQHPAFGTLTPKAWGVLVYRHMDHHLKQFGV